MHEGHRQRMLERLEAHEDSLQDHELLEILLFNAIPRKNTNEIAHNLLTKFGSFSALARADLTSLASVEGVGTNTAAYLRCVFLSIERIRLESVTTFPSARNYAAFSALLGERLRGLKQECIELFATDKDGNILGVESYTSHEQGRAQLEPRVVSKFFATHDPKALVIAHNHLSGSATPSHSDDIFTMKMQAACAFHGIPLYDHIIVAPDEMYSYHACSRFDYLKTLREDPLSPQK